jgi:hypothetical protein
LTTENVADIQVAMARIQTRRCVSLKRGLYDRLKNRSATGGKSMAAMTEKALEDYLAAESGSLVVSAPISALPPLMSLVDDLRKSWGM